MNITAINIVVVIAAAAGAFYMGISLPLSLSCGFIAASIVNIVAASINLSKINKSRDR